MSYYYGPKLCWDDGPNGEVVLVEYEFMDKNGNPIPLSEPTSNYPDLSMIDYEAIKAEQATDCAAPYKLAGGQPQRQSLIQRLRTCLSAIF